MHEEWRKKNEKELIDTVIPIDRQTDEQPNRQMDRPDRSDRYDKMSDSSDVHEEIDKRHTYLLTDR